MSKSLNFGEDAYVPLLKGVNKVVEAVGSTLGAEGRTVIISDRYMGYPYVTKDGVTVSKNIVLEDERENVAAMLMRYVAIKTVEDCGDATTSATVLAGSMINDGVLHLRKNGNAQEIKRGIEKGIKSVCDTLDAIKTDVGSDISLLKAVATISANNDQEIGGLISDAYDKIGVNGRLSIEHSKTGISYVDTPNGLEMPRGYIHPVFSTDEDKMIAYHQEPVVLVYNYDIENFVQIQGTLENILTNTNRPIVLIAKDILNEALGTLAQNFKTINEKTKQRNLNICVIKAPSNYQDEWLEDVAVFTGATLISDLSGLRIEDATFRHTGTCESLTCKFGTSLFVRGAGTDEAKEIQKAKIKTIGDTQQDEKAKEHQMARLAMFSNNIASIYVGGATDVEIREKHDRVDDAIRAVQSANEEGVVAGGGIGLLRCIKPLSEIKVEGDESIGVMIVANACEAPLRKMLDNAGIDKELFNKIYNGEIDNNFGYNIKTKNFENLFETGIIDAKKVVRCAITNAASVACGIITSNCHMIEMLPKK